ncbi:MAG: phosphoenolpyruvate--protein phosphotransferase [Elusimicrobia bacterium]|nr:phosphoenolpyruvate--protein phosphotransferase [Elusimicrobiota bacterium]
MLIIKGIPASPGIAIGKAYLFEDEVTVEHRQIQRDSVKSEVKRFKDAVKMTLSDLDATEAKVLHMLGKQHARLIEAHRLILKDPLITQEVARLITDKLLNAEFALSETLERVNKNFEKIDDEFFRDRRHDLFDVGKRLLRHLTRQERKKLVQGSEPAIVVAHNLYPSDTLHMREAHIAGFCTDIGGKTSHTALLAQSMELPAVVGLSDITKQVKNGELMIVDGEQGLVIANPGSEALDKYQKLQRQMRQAEKFLEKVKDLPSVTRDGRVVSVQLNLDITEDPAPFAALKPDGAGLVRTESLYMNRKQPPAEEEQYHLYQRLLKTFPGLPLTIRLADLGGDKLADLGFDSSGKEANPFLGLRGIRLLLRYPDLLKTQLRALLRATAHGDLKIMIPMVTSLSEILGVRQVLEESAAELTQEKIKLGRPPELGIMVEIPAAALTLDTLLSEADFVSIGTNDMIQYLLAVDRINQHVAHIYDSLHPAVLRLLQLIVQATHKKGKKVSLCGEMASDYRTTPLLAGMGLDTLSVTPRLFLRVKHTVRSVSFAKSSLLSQTALMLPTCEEVHKLVASAQADENA